MWYGIIPSKPIFDVYGGFGCIYDERAWSAASACVWIVDDRTKTKEEGEKESGARATPAIDILLIDIGHTSSNSSSKQHMGQQQKTADSLPATARGCGWYLHGILNARILRDI